MLPAFASPRSVPRPGPLFSSTRCHDWPPPSPSMPRGLTSSPARPPPLKSLPCRFEKETLHHRRSLSPYPLPPMPRAPICPSLLASGPGSTVGARHHAGIGAAQPPTLPLQLVCPMCLLSSTQVASPCCRNTPDPLPTAGAPPPLRIPITPSELCFPSSPRSLGESPPPRTCLVPPPHLPLPHHLDHITVSPPLRR
jgi:hypothetical protein